MINATLDLSIIARYGFGIDGYRWVSYLRVIKPTAKKPIEIMCLDVDVSFTSVKNRLKN